MTVRAVTERIGEFYYRLAQTICQFSRTVAVNIGDDMGHKAGLFIRPEDTAATTGRRSDDD